MKRKIFRRIISVITAILMAVSMMPVFAFAGTSAEKTADGDYHYAAFGDSIAAGIGAAMMNDEAFLELGEKAGVTDKTLKKSPEGGYVNLLADMLCNHIYSLPEDTKNFIRNDSKEWENIDSDSMFSFSNASTSGISTGTFLEIIDFDTESDEPKGSDKYYEDVFKKNFCNEKGECISNTPAIYANLAPMFANEDGTPNKVSISEFFCNVSKIYEDEIEKADVMTIGLGANDTLIGFTHTMYDILADDESGLYDVIKDALINGTVDFESVDISKMSQDNLVELLQLAEPANTNNMLDGMVDEGLENYDAVLNRIGAGKDGKDTVALISLYKPFGDSFESGGKNNVLPVLVGDILDSLIEVTESDEYSELALSDKTASSAMTGRVESEIISWITKVIKDQTGVELKDMKFDIEHLTKICKDFKGDFSEYRDLVRKLIVNFKEYKGAIDKAKGANEAQKAMITDMLVENIKMPLMYALLGVTSGDAIDKYNAGIKKLADKYGLKYVDISDLPADADVDPHPNLKGHEWIAGKAFAQLKEIVPPIIKASDIRTLKTSIGKNCIKVRYSAKNKGNVTGYTVQYKVKGTDKWKMFKNTEKTLVKINNLKKGKRYAVRVRAYNTNSFETVYGKWKCVTSKKVK